MSAVTRRASSYADPDAYLSARVRHGGSETRRDRYFVVKDASIPSGYADDGFVPAAVALAARNGDFGWLSGAPDAKDRYADAGSEADEPIVSADEKRSPEDASEASESSEPEKSQTATEDGEDDSEEEVEEEEEEEEETADARKARPPRAPSGPWESFSPPRGRANARGVSAPVPAPRGSGGSDESPSASEESAEKNDARDVARVAFEGLGRYELSDDLCGAVWGVAKRNMDALQPTFYARDAARKGYLSRTELRAALRDLEPRCSARQLDRVEAMLRAASSNSGASGPGGDVMRHTTLDALVRAAHGGVSAAARLETPGGCLSAARLVAALENAIADDAEKALSGVFVAFEARVDATMSANRRRVMLHRAILTNAPRVLLPAAIKADAASVRLLVAALDSPMGMHSGTGPSDPLIDDPARFPERLRSLRLELVKTARFRKLLEHGRRAKAKIPKQHTELAARAAASGRAPKREATRREPVVAAKAPSPAESPANADAPEKAATPAVVADAAAVAKTSVTKRDRVK